MISLAPRARHEVLTSENQRHRVRTGEGSADPFTCLHIALRIRMTATNICRRRYERGSGRNTVLELDWLKNKVNNMLIEPDWLNMLMDRGENKVISFKTSMSIQPHTWALGIAVFINRDAN